MCGRYTLAKNKEEIEELVGDIVGEIPIPLRYNIAPSQPVLTVLNTNPPKLTLTQWGLVPRWAKDPTLGSRMINARAETAAQKPAFRAPFRNQRCLILADGFYEWRKQPGRKTKQPWHIRLRSGKAFAFAGLWDKWDAADGTELTSSTILTTASNDLVSPIHPRMPVILPRAAHSCWLRENDLDALKGLLVPFPSEEMQAFPVTTRVNNARHDHPDCVEPAPPPRQTEIDF